MKHIRSKWILFMTLLVICSCLLVYLLVIRSFELIYMEELYKSAQNTVDQLSVNTDSIVSTVENSLDLIFTSREIIDIFNTVDFNKLNGDVFAAYGILDKQFRQFMRVFPRFEGMVVQGKNNSLYQFRYYNNKTVMDELEQTAWYKYINEQLYLDKFRWAGLYEVDTIYSNIIGSHRRDYFIVFKRIYDNVTFIPAAVAVAFLNPRVFAEIYDNIELSEGDSVFILDSDKQCANSTIDGYDDLFAELNEKNALKKGHYGYYLRQQNGSSYVVTYTSSIATGWSVVKITSLDSLTQKIRKVTNLCGLIVAFVVLCASLIIIWWAFRLSKRIIEVANAMERVSEHDLNVSLSTVSKDEIGIIYNGFNKMVENLRYLINEVIRQENSKKMAEIRAMQYQIKPHFLYNTIASIRMLALKDKNTNVANMLMVLGRLLRNTINVKDAFITIENELQNLKDYVEVQQIRYDNRLLMSYRTEEYLNTLKIPNMILQPMVENAIEHAFGERLSDSESECRIDIDLVHEGTLEDGRERVLLSIRDNGVGMSELEVKTLLSRSYDKDTVEHIGIINIHERLVNLFGSAYGVTIDSKRGEYTIVNIRTLAMREETQHD